MNIKGMLSITKKEIRSAFLSPVALIFIGVFLLITLFSFFTQSRFFIRGIADVRPLFEWMPLLLIFLVSAVSMRAWSEEARSGTLELLLTLPLKSGELVLGKFLAGLTLVSVALMLTLPIPYTVSQVGPLDFGPVIGGYLASILLASSYLAIGLCISAITENQIVSLMGSLIVCGLFYFLGSDTLLAFLSQDFGESISALGTGARFESIERGVLDLRDLFYLTSLTGFFLYLNTVAIERKRIDRTPSDRPSRWRIALTTAGLIGVNLVTANLHMEQLRPGRIDLTEDQLYSVSQVTEDVIANLPEQLTITGYFSERTHPLLAPLVPQIKDLLEEFAVKGGEHLVVSFVDPHTNEDVEEEIGSTFGIRAIPISVADRSEMAFVNAYFHILLQYGDEHRVLSFEELVDIKRDHSTDSVELRLKGLEYALTKSIKSVSQEFLSLDALLATQPVKITAYMTPQAQLPPSLASLYPQLTTLFGELESRAQKSGGTLQTSFVDPSSLSDAERARLSDEMGFMPIKSLDGSVYWLYGLVEVGEKKEVVLFLTKELGEDSLQQMVEAAIRRCAPGFRKTVGLFTKNETPDHPAMPYGQPPPQPKTDYRGLESLLSAQFEVRRLELKDELVPSDVDVLLLGKVGDLTPNQRFAIDQYLMGGGTLVALAGLNEIEPEFIGQSQQIPPTFKGTTLSTSLSEVLSNYGVSIESGYAIDSQALDIVYPKQSFGRIQVRQAAYPYFIQSTRDQFSEPAHVALSGLNSLTLLWPSPLSVSDKLPEGVTAKILLRTSEKGDIDSNGDLSPSVSIREENRGSIPLVVTLEGAFTSAFAADPERSDAEASSSAPEEEGNSENLRSELNQTGRTLKKAIQGAKIAIIGSSEMVSDLGLGVGNYYSGMFGLRGDYGSGVLMIQNLIEWAVEDDSLASIRTGGPSSRVLRSMSREEQNTMEMMNYGLAIIALIILSLLLTVPRRMASMK